MPVLNIIYTFLVDFSVCYFGTSVEGYIHFSHSFNYTLYVTKGPVRMVAYILVIFVHLYVTWAPVSKDTFILVIVMICIHFLCSCTVVLLTQFCRRESI